MKRINNYITEKLLISPQEYAYFPKTRKELMNIIRERIKEEGNQCDLNDINVSAITDMSALFCDFRYFNGDISDWDVSNVRDMHAMFSVTRFNGDISNWDVRNVEDMSLMFFNADGFDYNISDWDVRNVKNMSFMFYCTNIKNKHLPKLANLSKLSKWQIEQTDNMEGMFKGCRTFEGSALKNWTVPENTNIKDMFDGCASAPLWYETRIKK